MTSTSFFLPGDFIASPADLAVILRNFRAPLRNFSVLLHHGPPSMRVFKSSLKPF
jgi:hypothetical protein